MLDEWYKAFKRWVSIYDLIKIFRTIFSNFEGTLLKFDKFEKMTNCGTTLDNVHILEVDLTDETCSRWVTLNLKHAGYTKDLFFHLLRVLDGELPIFWSVRRRKALKVANLVVKRNGKS